MDNTGETSNQKGLQRDLSTTLLHRFTVTEFAVRISGGGPLANQRMDCQSV